MKHKLKAAVVGSNRSAAANRYLLAVVVVALATFLQRWLTDSFGSFPPFLLFYPAILLVATVAGSGPGITASFLSLLAVDYSFIAPSSSFDIRSPNDAITMAIFGGSSIFLCILAERLNRARLSEAVAVEQQQELALLDMGNNLILDLDRRIVNWSRGSSHLYGFEAAEAQGRLVDELLQTQSSQPLDQITGELVRRGWWGGEVTRRSRNGTVLSLSILLAVRRDRKGNPTAILESSADITRQKTSEEQLRLFIEHAPAALAMFDTDMRYLNVSRRWRTDLGLGDRTLDGTSHYEVFPEIPGRWKEIHRRCLAGAVLRAEADRFERADGSEQWVRWEVRPWHTVSGDIGGIVIFSEDVTGIKRAENFLGRYELIAQNSRDIVLFLRGDDGQVLEANAAAVANYGYSRDELMGLTIHDLRAPEALGMTAAQMIEADSHGILFETSHRRKDGSCFPVEVSARGAIIGGTRSLVSVIRDITTRKQAEQALITLNEELEERVAQRTAELRAKDDLLLMQSRQAAMGEMGGNIAHQWRQPLNALGLTVQQQLLFYDLGEFTREFLEDNVNKSMALIRHMSRTIDDFRNYFRPDKEKAEFKVQEAVAGTLSLISDGFKNKHIGIALAAQDDPVVNGFRNEFAQVILNILTNADDALTERAVKDPRVTITIGAENGRAVVTISDNAGGIPEGIIGKIFDPYFTTKGPQAGTGVGLFMSKAIIEKNMQGRLTARNIADGAEFRIEV